MIGKKIRRRRQKMPKKKFKGVFSIQTFFFHSFFHLIFNPCLHSEFSTQDAQEAEQYNFRDFANSSYKDLFIKNTKESL